jgi:hypothetical protein
MAPRTIDNLGLAASTRYAVDQQELDKKILKEARGIPRQAEVDVTTPFFASEFDLLFDTSKKNTSWALFTTPKHYGEQRKRLFTYQIIPSLGTQEKTENQEKKIQAQLKEKTDEQNRERKKKQNNTEWEEDIEQDEQEREQKILLALLKNLIFLDKCMVDITARRMQYQKG